MLDTNGTNYGVEELTLLVETGFASFRGVIVRSIAKTATCDG